MGFFVTLFGGQVKMNPTYYKSVKCATSNLPAKGLMKSLGEEETLSKQEPLLSSKVGMEMPRKQAPVIICTS